ncbi:MAG: hypothetical protein IID36_02955 [Planctomycetes bacterium]|nr:hypothetical protein [Planctomycetota bacterium]
MSIQTLNLKRNLIVIWSIFAGYLFLFGFLAYRGGIASVPAITYFALAFFLVYGMYLYRNRRRNKIITWPDGFQFIKKGVPSPVYPWNEIKSLRKSVIDGWVFLSLHDGTEQRLFSPTFFGTHKRAARFVKEINELREEYVRRGQ